MPDVSYRNFAISLTDILTTASSTEKVRFEGIQVLAKSASGGEAPGTVKAVGLKFLGDLVSRKEKRAFTFIGLEEDADHLRAVLFPGKVMALLQAERQRLVKHERIRIQITCGPDLESVPWEMVTDTGPDQGPAGSSPYLVLQDDISIVRRGRPEADDVRGLAVQPGVDPMEVLVIDAAYVGGQGQNLDCGEQGPLEPGSDDTWVGSYMPTPITLNRIMACLDSPRPVVYLKTHGRTNPPGIVVEDGRGGEALITPDQLARELRKASTQLVVLPGCGAGVGEGWSGFGAVLLEMGIPAVVSMQSLNDGRADETFSRALFHSLANGRSLDEAVSVARRATWDARRFDDWWVPMLHSRNPDSVRLVREQTAPDPKVDLPAVGSAAMLETLDGNYLLVGTRQGTFDSRFLDPSDESLTAGLEAFGPTTAQSLALSPTGRAVASLNGNRLQVASVDPRGGVIGTWRAGPFKLEGEPQRLLAVDDAQLSGSRGVTCLVSYETTTQRVWLGATDGTIDILKTFEGSAIDGIESRGAVVLIQDHKIRVDGNTFNFCRSELRASLGALTAIDCVRLGWEHFILVVYDDSLTVFGSNSNQPVYSGTLSEHTSALLVRPGKGVSSIKAVTMSSSGVSLVPVTG